ncbi:MAG: hypothetical protein MJY87_03865 [Fibrobacter sp.]|nr:hypothetical protein [Fibrobacter sp.]
MFISTGALAGILFSLFVVLVAFVISILLYRDLRSRQDVYAGFSRDLNEFIVIMSKDGILLDLMPKHIDDPLYRQLAQNQSFENILSISDLNRFNDYIRGLDAYPDIPFVFSYNSEEGVLWYGLRAVMQKTGAESHSVYLIKNMTLDVESRSQRDTIQKNMDMLLQGTGDFLWSLDVENRQFSILTPMSDDEGRVVPRSVGVQDIHTILPKVDFKFFADTVNSRIVDFRATGHDHDEHRSFKVRIYGENSKLIWYSFRCKVINDENARLKINGTARRMDVLMESSTFNEEAKDALLSSAFSFPELGIFCVDRDFRIQGCNQTFALEHGASNGAFFIGKDAKTVFKMGFANIFTDLCMKVFESGRPVSWRGLLDAEGIASSINVTPVEQDNIVNKILISYSYTLKSDFEQMMKKEMELL